MNNVKVYVYNDYISNCPLYVQFTSKEVAAEMMALAQEFSLLPKNSLVGMSEFERSIKRGSDISERLKVLSDGKLTANDTLRGKTVILFSQVVK